MSEMMGHDPLAWIKEEPSDAPATEEKKQEVTTSSESGQVMEESVVEPRAEAAAEIAEEPKSQPEVVEPTVTSAAPEVENQLNLGEQLGIASVSNLRAEWLDRLSSGVESPLLIEGGEVQSVDTAGLQLLISLVRELEKEGLSWRWGERSPTLQGGIEELGLARMVSL